MKTNLYIFNPYSSVGGGDKTLKRLMQSINIKKYNITLFSLSGMRNFSKNIKFLKLKSKSTLTSFFQIKKIIDQDISSKKIFFSMQYFVNVPAILFLRKVKNLKIIIYEINHPNELNYSEELVQYIKNKILKFLVKKIYYKADIVASNSKELSNDLSLLIKKTVKTIYNPCFYKMNLIKKKKFNKNKINILNISRFEFQKDHLTLLRAINSSKIKNKIRLNLVGYGSKENIIKDYINRNKINCRIYKNKTNLSAFYRSNDLFIMTSLYEGLPTVMVEAASNCLPIISSKFKSGSMEILGNGKFGHLFEPKDFKSLSNILDNFYENPKIFFKKEKLCRGNLKKFSFYENTKKFNLYLNKLSN